MKPNIAWPVVALVAFGAAGIAFPGELKDQMKIEVESAQLHPGMDPGKYVCAEGHLHIKGSVQNLADVPVGPIKVSGEVFDAEGKLLGTATASTKQPVLNPNEKAPVNLEFLTVTGALVKQVKNQELTALAVTPGP